MDQRYHPLAVVLCSVLLTAQLVASELVVYPNGGQSKEQQEQDRFSCYTWAKGDSGFDPMAPPTATKPPPQQQAQKGGVGRGAIAGGVIGGIVGGSSDAKTGALVGGVVGGMRRQSQVRQEAQKRQNWEQEQTQQYVQQRNRYNRAFAACMEGKNYTVR